MRRLFPAIPLLVILLALCGVAGQQPLNAAPAVDHPNVLFIAVDDLNDWIGCLGGHPQAKTPNMDRLAARGTLFTSAHCQVPICNPSRTSILTGQRPSTTGVYALDPWFRTVPALHGLVTLPEYLQAHGYRTFSAGKIFHDGYPPKEERVDGREFNHWGYPGAHGPRPEKKFVNTPAPHPLVDWGVYPPRDEDQEDWKVADSAIDELKSTRAPFFLSVGFRHPHLPCYASQKWFDLYPEETLQLPAIQEHDRADTPRFSWYLHWKLPEPRLAWLQRSHQWKPLVRAYLASVSFVDSQIGRVLDALEKSGQSDKTIVVLWSDHGWHLGEKEISGKNSLWERSTHVPLIFAGPGIARSARCARTVELLDLYPTLAELCGLPPKRGLEGHSIVPQLRDSAAARKWPAITTQGPNNHTVRTEDWRYIRYADGSEELYDLHADPHEWTNLASRPEYAARKKELARWLPKRSAPPVPGSNSRLIDVRNGIPYWEGQPIGPHDAVPMDD